MESSSLHQLLQIPGVGKNIARDMMYSTGYIPNTNDYRLIRPGTVKMGELEG